MSTLYEIEQGEIKNPSSLHRLAGFFDIPIRELDPTTPKVLANRAAMTESDQHEKLRLAPVISWEQAAGVTHLQDLSRLVSEEKPLPAPARAGRRSFYLKVRGMANYNASGAPSLAEGEMVCIDPDAAPGDRKLVLYRLNGQGPEIRQYVIEAGKTYLRALNPAWPSQIVPLGRGAEILGVVVGKWADL